MAKLEKNFFGFTYLERSLKTYRSEGDLELQMKSNHNSEGELYRCEKNSENLPHQSPPLEFTISENLNITKMLH
jgi:hypothetical protein